MEDVIFNVKSILSISKADIASLKQLALKSWRKRSRLCLHRSNDDSTHEMILVFHKSTYIRPHRHPHGKTESYHVVEGAMTVLFFDDFGNVIESIGMGEHSTGKPFLYRLSDSIWHMPLPQTEWLIYHETFTGPFIKDSDVEYAAWAPAENNALEVDAYLTKLNANLGEIA